MACAIILGLAAPNARGERVPTAAPHVDPTPPSSKQLGGRAHEEDHGDIINPEDNGGVFRRR